MKKQQKKRNLKKGAWFYKVRGSYLPATWQGWATYVPFVAFLVWSWNLALKSEVSLSVAAFAILVSWVGAAMIMTWIASQKS
jgi:hypothetical protein